MADDLSYTFSHNAEKRDPDNANADLESPLASFATCDLIPIDGHVTLAINRVNGKQQIIARDLVEALKTCTAFDTLKNHSQRLCSTHSELAGQNAVVLQTLEQLLEQGLLLEASEICKRLNRPTKRALPASRVFVITCDRPAALERLLESMLRAGNLTRHNALYLVDDSRDVKNRDANKAVLEKFNVTSAQELTYFGAEEQQRLLDQLIEESPQHEDGFRFLIDRERWGGRATYGRSRTLCLLLSVGYRAIVLDDDVLCQALDPAVPEEGVLIGGNGQREASFFSSPDDLLGHAIPQSESPLDQHARFLGAQLGSVVTELNKGMIEAHQLRGVNAAMSNVWTEESPVLITQCGSWGDPGTGDAHWSLNLSEHSISRLLHAEGGLAKAIENRCVWLGAARPTVVKMASMSQMTGLDNSALLPPYFPVFRGEDLLFASMVEYMHSHGAVLDLGFAVPHLPDQRERTSLREPIAKARGVGLCAEYLTDKTDYSSGDNPAQRMKSLEDDLRRLANRSDDSLLLDFRREVAKAHAATLHKLRRQQSATRDFNSGNWQGYLERGVQEIQNAFGREWTPADLDGAPTNADAGLLLEEFRDLLRGYADALAGWQTMRDLSSRM